MKLFSAIKYAFSATCISTLSFAATPPVPGTDAYITWEEKSTKNAISNMTKHGYNIVPTPKTVSIDATDTIILPKASQALVIDNQSETPIAAEIIQKKLNQLGISSANKAITPVTKPRIIIKLLDATKMQHKSSLPPDLPTFPQGYLITTRTLPDGQRTYSLIGRDKEGLIYAAVTFSQLLKKVNDNLILPTITIKDWPDVLNRVCSSLKWDYVRVFRWKTTRGTTEAKKSIDRALNNKINCIFGLNLKPGQPFTAAQKKWFKEVNDYAGKRYIKIIYRDYLHIGHEKEKGHLPAYKDCIRAQGGFLFSWSKDDLIKKRVEELKHFLKETGFKGVYLHTRDTRNSGWHARSEDTRFRFGNDRMKADANLINLFYELKKADPELLFCVVPRPYVGNLNRPKNLISMGELRNSTDMSRFSNLIPRDVLLCWRESNRESINGFRKHLRQPLFLYQGTSVGGRTMFNRMLQKTFNYCRTYFTPIAQGAFYYCNDWPYRDVSNLGAVEYSWNLYAPGSEEFITPDAYSKTLSDAHRAHQQGRWDPFPNDKPEGPLGEAVKRFCNYIYTPAYGHYFYSVFTSMTDIAFIYNTATYERHCMKHVGIELSLEEKLAFTKRIIKNSAASLQDLNALRNLKPTNEYVVMAMNYYYDFMWKVKAGAVVLAKLYETECLYAQGKINAAATTLKTARHTLKQQKTALSKALAVINKQPIFVPSSSKYALLRLDQLGKRLDIVALKINSTLLANKPTPARQVQKDKPGIVKVALFDPRPLHGKVYGADSLKALLNSDLSFEVSSISSINLKTLQKFDCLVIPDCKSFGTADVSITDLLCWVRNHGGGIYFQHDSCGYYRWPPGASLFPSLVTKVGRKIGTSPGQPNYNANDTKLTIINKFFYSKVLPENLTFSHHYYDHFNLAPGPNGKVIARDRHGKPVIIAGQVGSGRIVFDGTILLSHQGKEKIDHISFAEKALLLSGIRWSSGTSGIKIKLSDTKKQQLTFNDGVYPVLTFSLLVNSPKPLESCSVTLTFRCAQTGNSLSTHTLAKDITINQIWAPSEPLQVKLPQSASTYFIAINIHTKDKAASHYFQFSTN